MGPKGVIEGDAVSIGGRVIRKKGASLKGKDISLGLPLKKVEKIFFLAMPMAAAVGAAALGLAAVFGSLGFVALIILVLALFEKQVLKAHRVLSERPLRSLVYGLLGFCCIVPILVFLEWLLWANWWEKKYPPD